MAAPKLEWEVSFDELENTIWYAQSNQKEKQNYFWRFKYFLKGNVVRIDFSDTSSGLMNRYGADAKSDIASIESAKAWCQAREDEAWVAANPVKEFTDTEILDCLEGDIQNYYDPNNQVWHVRRSWGTNTYYVGKTRREAVTAYLRANPPETPAETAREPKPDREMTLGELEKICEEKHLLLQFYSCNEKSKKANIWQDREKGHLPISSNDSFDPTISGALKKCLAAIEKYKAENPY